MDDELRVLAKYQKFRAAGQWQKLFDLFPSHPIVVVSDLAGVAPFAGIITEREAMTSYFQMFDERFDWDINPNNPTIINNHLVTARTIAECTDGNSIKEYGCVNILRIEGSTIISLIEQFTLPRSGVAIEQRMRRFPPGFH